MANYIIKNKGTRFKGESVKGDWREENCYPVEYLERLIKQKSAEVQIRTDSYKINKTCKLFGDFKLIIVGDGVFTLSCKKGPVINLYKGIGEKGVLGELKVGPVDKKYELLLSVASTVKKNKPLRVNEVVRGIIRHG